MNDSPGRPDRSLRAGSVVWILLDPAIGHEQSGRRPGVVVSPQEYHDVSSLSLVCPITTNTTPWPFKYVLTGQAPIQGAVLCDQLRAVDRRRIRNLAGEIDDVDLSGIRILLGRLIGPDAPR